MKPKKLIAIRHCVLNVVPGDKRGAKPKNVAILADSLPHTVLPQTDVRRSDFVVIFFHCTQNWTALNFAVSFRVLIQPYSSRLLNSFCRGGLD